MPDCDDTPFPIRADEGRLEPSLVPSGGTPLVETIRPKRFVEPFHVHPSIEINFLDEVRFTHVFSGVDLPLPERRLILFWGSVPHRARAVSGNGTVTNVYLSLPQFLSNVADRPLIAALLRGDVIAARGSGNLDRAMLERFLAERNRPGQAWGLLHLQELAARLKRLSLEGWEVLHRAPDTGFSLAGALSSARHVRLMLEWMSEHYTEPQSITQIAAVASVSPSHGAEVFRTVTGTTPIAYLTALRLSHARAMLAGTGLPVAQIAADCGFGSLSRFYEAFGASEGCAPGEWRRSMSVAVTVP